MSSLLSLALVILLAPFVAFLLNAFVAQRNWRLAGAFTIVGVGTAFVTSLLVFVQVFNGAPHLDQSFRWLTIGANQSRSIEVGLAIDAMTAVMLLAVTGVSLLVQIYSWGYLHETEYDEHGHPHIHRDPGFARYYTWMALFTFSMLGLVLGNGFLTLFIFWELVGLCSYLLIGFWYDRGRTEPRPLVARGYEGQYADARLSPPEAAKKAFLTTRIGDVGLLIGMLLIWSETGTFTFSQLEPIAGRIPETLLTIAALLIFCGAVGKSAQFPLHVWLPDAMEGPTPVSALIHAATMVAAGVYLVARSFFLFEHAPVALLVVAVIGGFTALLAGTMGLVNNDIKRVMAYSTVSQLGYMFLVLGLGAPAVAIFHLFSHAWFKALLFLTAGSVIHGTGTQDMREMGGLMRKMPGTFLATLIAGMSLIGIPPLSGFWSKDLIIHNVMVHPAFLSGGPLASLELTIDGLVLFFALLTILMTGFYTTRLLVLTFGGQWRGDPHHYEHVHESPPAMLVPMLILIVPTVLIGLWGSPMLENVHFLAFLEGHPVHEELVLAEAGGALGLGLAGIVIAWLLYGSHTFSAARLTRFFGPLYRGAYNKWGFDDLYNWLVGEGTVGTARGLAWLDRTAIDGVVNGVAAFTVGLGRLGRSMQSGQLQTYAWVVFGGLVVVGMAVVLPVLLRGPAGR